MEEMELNATPSRPLSIGSKNEMSAGLRERLKRCGRYRLSPSSASKRSCKEHSPETSLTLPTNGRAIFQTPPSSKLSLGGSQPPTSPVVQAHLCTSTESVATDELSRLSLPIDLARDTRSSRLEPKKLLERSIPKSQSKSSIGLSALNSLSESRSDCVVTPNTTFTSETNELSKELGSQNLLSESVDNNIDIADKKFDVSSVSSELEIMVSSPQDVRYLESSLNNSVDGSLVNVVILAENSLSPDVIVKRKRELEERIKRKEEALRKLNLVKMYRVKNDLNNLDMLTSKWKSVCQEALLDLLASASDPRPSMIQLINHLQIDPQMVDYNVEDESFA